MPAIFESPDIAATLPMPDYPPRTLKNAKRAKAPNRTRILSVSAEIEDHNTLQSIVDGLPVQLSSVFSCQEAFAYLRNDRAAVVFCDYRMKDGTWEDVLQHVLETAEPPLVVVTSRLADERLWAEVLNLGGWDVLAKPFHVQEVLHVLDSAWIRNANPVPRTRVAGAS